DVPQRITAVSLHDTFPRILATAQIDQNLESSGSPHNKGRCVSLLPLDRLDMSAIFKDYEKAFKYIISDTIKDSIIIESSGHACTFMALLRYFHKKKPTGQQWPELSISRYEKLMNGTSLRLRKSLEDPIVRNLVRQRIATFGSKPFTVNIQDLTMYERLLFDIGILSE